MSATQVKYQHHLLEILKVTIIRANFLYYYFVPLSNLADKKADIKIFDEVMDLLLDEYSRALMRFIADSTEECDEVLLCGGTAYFVRPYLEQYFEKEGIEVVWDGGVKVPESVDKHDLSYRLADCYAMHEIFVRGVDKLTKYERYGATVG